MNKHNNPNHQHYQLAKGDRLFIFEDKFFTQLINEHINDVFYNFTNTNVTNTELSNENVNL